ncbi:glycosyl transferase [Paracoccus fistulariae]|uniref:Glycosyl transferase n=1 Tax=Paracoccus fistulariae TaxID=658446 RepID=A0ABY7SKZ0_9RHOB|nr:glycosyl transferase [Paracoccus fistulariae]MDB6181537.1 glycosyl transferase [Paracoccus fistulariae]WCR07570.1 glycosyl transferase [Paracoccus fistulariae]
MSDIKQIICIKWGSKFGPEYVNRLHGMVARNITPPFRLICFTDDGTGLHPDIVTRPLPEFHYEAPQRTRGKWPKSRLWGDLGDITGTVLFLDLDVVITGNLDDFFTYGDPEDTILGRNPNTPFERLGQTSVYRMKVGNLRSLQDIFRADPQGVADEYRYEQRFVTRNAPGGVKFWPRGWLAHFRMHCVPVFPLNYLRQPRIPRDTKIVIFPGNLNPQDAIEGRWSEDDRHRSPGDHLRAAFSPDRREGFVKHLRHYVLPTGWVRDLWQE